MHAEAASSRSSASDDALTLVAVCVAPFVTQLATFALSPFLPFVAADLGRTVAVLGQVPALAFFAAAVLGRVDGRSGCRWRRRWAGCCWPAT